MPIDYGVWGQTTVAEVRYGRETAIHIRILASVVTEARALFSPGEDVAKFNPHLDLAQQLYQLHIFNAASGDAYINNVPFGYVKQLLWHLHRHPQQRKSLVLNNANIQFQDFASEHKLSEKPGIVGLYVGHEKYGLFDLVQQDKFVYLQLHRAVLYGAFLRELGYKFKDRDIQEALPPGIKEQVKNGASLKKAVEKSIDLTFDGDYTVHSVLEALTLIVDAESPRLGKANLKVCRNNGDNVYWTDYKGRMILYRMIDPAHPKAKTIRIQLEEIIEQECPICVETHH